MLAKAKLSEDQSSLLCIIYGVDSVGKTTFGIDAPNPIVLGKEKGIPRGRKVMCIDPGTYTDIITTIKELTTSPHDYKTLVLDSLDWFEPLVWAHVCTKNKWSDIEAPGYGKGYIAANDTWRELIGLLTELREKRNMHIIAIAHSEVKAFNDPSQPAPYDRYQLKLNGKAAALWREFVDFVGFANFEVFTQVDKNTKKAKAYGDGTRVIYTERRPSFDAKNRLGLPFQIPLSFAEFQKALAAKPLSESEKIIADIKDLTEEIENAETRAKIEASVKMVQGDAVQLDKLLKRVRALTGDANG